MSTSCSSSGGTEEGIESGKSLDGLTLITFLERSAKVFASRTSIVYGDLRYTWSKTHQRCLKLASVLTTQLHVFPRHIVATFAPNLPAMYELHFAVPMAGAILCALNTRLDSSSVSTLLAHSEAKVLFVDYQLINVASEALHLLSNMGLKPPLIVLITDSTTDENKNYKYDYEYENFLASGDDKFKPQLPNDEWDAISVNYTSGTTSV